MREAGAAGLSPVTAVPYASLSKAITGVCVATLIESGKLAFETPVSQSLARTLSRTGRPVDPRVLQVTVSELLVHRGASVRAVGDMARWLRGHSGGNTAFDEQLRWLFALSAPIRPGRAFRVLERQLPDAGAIIEEAAGQPYERYCREAVLTPVGARDATLDPQWRILSSYGGWRMPLAQYGRFYQVFAPGNRAIGPRSRAWMMSPEGKQVGGGAYYGLGTFVRPTPRGGGNFWHAGAWSYDLANAHDGTDPHHILRDLRRSAGALDLNMVSFAEPRREHEMANWTGSWGRPHAG